jgi:hypothetical protein
LLEAAFTIHLSTSPWLLEKKTCQLRGILPSRQTLQSIQSSFAKVNWMKAILGFAIATADPSPLLS